MNYIKNTITLGFIVLFSFNTGYSQTTEANFLKTQNILNKRGEVYFKFFISNDKGSFQSLKRVISIDKIKGDTVYAYANKRQFSNFIGYHLNYTVLPAPSELYSESKLKSSQSSGNWNTYPTYSEYVNLMDSFAQAHPDICKLYQTGTTVDGRKILFVKISDSVNVKEDEPEFMYSSTMHGDEVVGYVLMLHLIDFLLSNYGKLPYVTNLVNHVEIWINPLANPDGTYNGGDNTITSATRYNANAVDLNRNFPDPEDGNHPDAEAWQPETSAMMSLLKAHRFALAANLHGGSEVVNYPWDTWKKRHPDDNWYRYASLQFADSAMTYGPSGYFTDVTDSGITDGYDWYTISGGRQDYNNYFTHGREVTIELSDVKMPAASKLPTYWSADYRSFLYYIQQCLFGIRGIVTDSLTGAKLVAKIEVIGHDADSSQIYSDSTNGDYHRLIYKGTYNLKFSASGYRSAVYKGVPVKNKEITVLNVKLYPETGSNKTDTFSYAASSDKSLINIYQPDTTITILDTSSGTSTGTIANTSLDNKITSFPNPFSSNIEISMILQTDENVEIALFDMLGKKVKELANEKFTSGQLNLEYDLSGLPAGIYICTVRMSTVTKCIKLIKD
jgi:hypothetical protein